jgi:hypothetical protein
MSAAELFQGFPRRAHPTLLYILKALTDSLQCVGLGRNIKQALIGFGILHHRFCFSIDGEDQGLLGLLKMLDKFRWIAAKSSHGLNIFLYVEDESLAPQS